MSKKTTTALFAISTLSLVSSTATLAVMLIGVKRVQDEIEDVKTKANKNATILKKAFLEMEF